MDSTTPATVIYPNAFYQHLESVIIGISWTTALCLSIAIWDWLTSLGDEYNRIWKREKTLISVLYIAARYWILMGLSICVWLYLSETHTQDFCNRWHRLSVGIMVPVEAFSGLILLVRTYAFTRQNRWVLLIMSICLAGQTAFMCVCVKMGVALVPWVRVGQTTGRCFTGPSQENLLVIGYFLCPLFYATICAGVTLQETLRSRNRMSAMRKSPVYIVFMREGALYYLAIGIVIIVNIGLMAQPDVSLQGSAYFFVPLIDATMSCRLVLSLRDADSTQFNSNVNVKSLWATMPYESEDHTDRNAATNHTHPGGNQAFALSTVAHTEGSGVPVNVNIERVVHFSADEEYADLEKKMPNQLA